MNDAARTDPQIVAAVRAATRVVVLTGAGVSAESGIPTFRDKQSGLWERFDASELATPDAFERDPALVWGWYEWRRAAILNAKPNPAHVAIAAMAHLAPRFTLITQNVDDLHERAGSREVLHLHGELARPYCANCRQSYVYPNAPPLLPPGGKSIEPPRCGCCGARIRPGVVWFGEGLPAQIWSSAARIGQAMRPLFLLRNLLAGAARCLTDRRGDRGWRDDHPSQPQPHRHGRLSDLQHSTSGRRSTTATDCGCMERIASHGVPHEVPRRKMAFRSCVRD